MRLYLLLHNSCQEDADLFSIIIIALRTAPYLNFTLKNALLNIQPSPHATLPFLSTMTWYQIEVMFLYSKLSFKKGGRASDLESWNTFILTLSHISPYFFNDLTSVKYSNRIFSCKSSSGEHTSIWNLNCQTIIRFQLKLECRVLFFFPTQGQEDIVKTYITHLKVRVSAMSIFISHLKLVVVFFNMSSHLTQVKSHSNSFRSDISLLLFWWAQVFSPGARRQPIR